MRENYNSILGRFSGKRILVIGDIMLDVYVQGISNRLSPEAPVPVVDVVDEKYIPGGAANVACNLRMMDAHVLLCSIAGDDDEGNRVIRILDETGIDTSAIVQCNGRTTISKCRVMSGSQCITRIDKGTIEPPNGERERLLISHIIGLYDGCDAIIISDYGKGTITASVLACIVDLQRKHEKVVALDSKCPGFFTDLPVTIAKPNYEEVVKLLSIPVHHADRMLQVREHAVQLSQAINARYIAVTLDEQGSVIVSNGEPIFEVRAPKIDRPYVSGAGDTYLATFTLAWLASADIRMSAELANMAASIAVQKEFTSCSSVREILRHLNIKSKWIGADDELDSLCSMLRAEGKRIVFTNGCFDILHSGHVTYLRCAKELGDILIVGLNNDESIRRLKGDQRPVNALEDRMEVLAALSCVDYVVPFGEMDDDTPMPLLRIVRPDVFAKGGDYTIEKLPEAEMVTSNGGKIVILPHIPDHSTTQIIRKITRHQLTSA